MNPVQTEIEIVLGNTAVSRKFVQENRTRQCRKVLWVMGFMVFDWGFWCFIDIEGNITNKSIYALSFLVGKHREPQSINAKLSLPIIPIGIVAYALTLLWDNLCRNSCIWHMTPIYGRQYANKFYFPTSSSIHVFLIYMKKSINFCLVDKKIRLRSLM